jgi:hypothetical protein
VFRTVAVLLAVAGVLAPRAVADPVTLVSGVTYDREVDLTPHGPVVVHVVTAPRPGGTLSLQVGLSNDAVDGSEKLTSIERRLQPTATTVGVAADLANAAGQPVGLLLRGGALDHAPLQARTSLLVDSAATLHVDCVKLLATWQGAGPRRAFSAVNARPPTNGLALYTPAWGPETPLVQGGTVAVLQTLTPLVPGAPVSGRVLAVGDNGPTPIPPDGAVLVAHGVAGDYLRDEAAVGQTVTIPRCSRRPGRARCSASAAAPSSSGTAWRSSGRRTSSIPAASGRASRAPRSASGRTARSCSSPWTAAGPATASG